MAQTYGREVLGGSGRQVMVAVGSDAHWKTGGITLGWPLFEPAEDAVTLPDETKVRAGQRYARFGQIVCRVTDEESDHFGEYGPYDPAADDGREELRRGECFILNETRVEGGVIAGLTGGVDMHPAVLDGGRVWKARLLAGGAGDPLAGTLAAGPTWEDFEAAFPRVEYVQNR